MGEENRSRRDSILTESNSIILEALSTRLDEILISEDSIEYEELQLAVCEFLDDIDYEPVHIQHMILSKLLRAHVNVPGSDNIELSSLLYFFQEVCRTPHKEIMELIEQETDEEFLVDVPEISDELLESPVIPNSILKIILSKTPWEGTFLHALRHPNTSTEDLQKIFEQGPPEHLYEGDLESLSQIIAGHKNTPLYIIEKLASNEDMQVRTAAIINIASREETDLVDLARYAIHEDIRIRTAAFNNPNATEEIRASAALLGVNEGDDEGDE